MRLWGWRWWLFSLSSQTTVTHTSNNTCQSTLRQTDSQERRLKKGQKTGVLLTPPLDQNAFRSWSPRFFSVRFTSHQSLYIARMHELNKNVPNLPQILPTMAVLFAPVFKTEITNLSLVQHCLIAHKIDKQLLSFLNHLVKSILSLLRRDIRACLYHCSPLSQWTLQKCVQLRTRSLWSPTRASRSRSESPSYRSPSESELPASGSIELPAHPWYPLRLSPSPHCGWSSHCILPLVNLSLDNFLL